MDEFPNRRVRNIRSLLIEGRNEEWRRLLDESDAYLQACQKELVRAYGLDTRDRYEWEPEPGTLMFFTDEKLVVRASTQFVGSVSTTSDTWLWGWSNPDFTLASYKALLVVAEYGVTHAISWITEDMWEAYDADGWDMAAVSNYLIKARGVYRIPSDTGSSFHVIMDIGLVPEAE